jgi:AcrR family transcriptional regulator
MSTGIASKSSSPTSQRGAKTQERREQILSAADAHFRKFGYAETTVAELAKAIDVSPAYIHKLFGSKQGLGDAVVGKTLSDVATELRQVLHSSKPAATRLRLLYQTVVRRGTELFTNEEKLHDLAITACIEKWPAVQEHQAALLDIIRSLIAEGRELGEFERKTPIAETSSAVQQTLELFSQPLFLRQHSDDPELRAMGVADLVLRSLAY